MNSYALLATIQKCTCCNKNLGGFHDCLVSHRVIPTNNFIVLALSREQVYIDVDVTSILVILGIRARAIHLKLALACARARAEDIYIPEK